MKNCIFCKIAKGEIPHNQIYQDRHTVAFLDISPVNKGHTLVIPKKHYETIDKVPKNELDAVIETVQKISKALLKFSDGVNIMQNNKSAAGQLVPHIHFHVIPRNKNDGFRFNWRNKKYSKDEDKKLVAQIKKLL